MPDDIDDDYADQDDEEDADLDNGDPWYPKYNEDEDD